jgi:hypothetical protein
MPHAIIRGKNGRRHEVDFGDAPVRVEIYHSDETVKIFIEADFPTIPEERRRFALLNISRHLFSEAIAAAARRAVTPRPASSTCWEISTSRLNLAPAFQPRRRSARQPFKVEWHPGSVCRFHRSGTSG